MPGVCSTNRPMQRDVRRAFAELECTISPRQLVGTLRVGDQQLIEIAKALSLEADILIMDEPTSALTETEVARLFRVIERLRKRGVTMLYISHKMDEVFRLADRITVLRDGNLVKTLNRADTNPREITHLMVGREIEETRLGGGRSPGETSCWKSKQLSLPWPGHARKWRLRNIDFSLRRGEILGIAGLMGAGRTELLECLFGASSLPPQGEIRAPRPSRFGFRHPAEAREAGMALVTEDRKRLGLFSHLNVGENITLCTLTESANAGVIDRRARIGPCPGNGRQSGRQNRRHRRRDHQPQRRQPAESASLAAGCSPSRKYCCSTIQRAASMWAPKPSCIA